MPLKAVLEAAEYETLDQGIRAFYVQREVDGKYIPDIDGDAVSEWRKVADHERRQRSTATTAKSELERTKSTLEQQLQALQQQLTELQGQPGGSGDQKSHAEKLKREYDDRLKAIEAKLTEREQELATEREKSTQAAISDALRSALIEAGIPKDSINDLVELPRFRAPWKMANDGPAPYDGESVRPDPDAPGRSMSAKAYVKEYLKENKHWLPPSAGGGATGSSGGLRGGVIKANREQYREASQYNALKEQAEKSGATIQWE